MMGHKEPETSTTIVDLPIRHPLPLELNCEIFKCLKLPIQRKFIWGLGQDIYGMFGQKLLKKTKRVRNPSGNQWNNTNTTATIAADGLHVRGTTGFSNVFAEQSFPTSGPLSRMDEFTGTILYYYEVKNHLSCNVGLSGAIDNSFIGLNPNSYAIPIVSHPCRGCCLAGERHRFELPVGAIRPEMKQFGNVLGCGLVLNPDNKLAIFFTFNGQLLGRKVPINPTVDRLFPAVTMEGDQSSFVTNFGDDPAKSFEYDIHNCPGLELACI